MKDLKLTVTVDEANLILEGLGNLPFAKVYSLVGKIQQQASEQLEGGELPSDPSAAPPSAPQVMESEHEE